MTISVQKIKCHRNVTDEKSYSTSSRVKVSKDGKQVKNTSTLYYKSRSIYMYIYCQCRYNIFKVYNVKINLNV